MVGSYKKAENRCLFELYAKVGSTPLTALKTSSKCSFIPYKLRFLVSFRLVMEHDPCFCMRLSLFERLCNWLGFHDSTHALGYRSRANQINTSTGIPMAAVITKNAL
uniref:Uncharacterized protein n=1 Tax=Candidatus Kentrum sp. DK TaxID=2126562 RepID=A0A450T9L2_9GAMM|nr:MAG: hypothetical protein BECKDK2373B_GA0170837_11259 [Candidatus Kentron sp. DK]